MILEFLPYDAGGPIWQVVHSAAANAKHNYGLDKKKIIIDEVLMKDLKENSTTCSGTSI
jgi:ribosomal protein L22